MKVLVTYYTQSGNTEKIAKAIHEEASKAHESHLKQIGEVNPGSIDDHDLVFVGSPCHGGDLAAQIKEFLGSLPQSRGFKLAGFVTHSSDNREDFEKCIQSFENASKDSGLTFHGCYDCQGSLSPEIQPFVKQARNVPDDEWEEMMQEIDERPTAEDVQKAKDFAREVLSKA